jgi:hypothetical protein
MKPQILLAILAGSLAIPAWGRGAPDANPAFGSASALTNAALRPEFVLPGTQPREGNIDLGEVSNCRKCHGDTQNGAADPYFSWQGGMMAQAARDPVFRAALAVANQDIAGVGEFCIRCHSPRGWLAGRSEVADASKLEREDLHGVSCVVCHRLVDPASPEAGKMAKQLPPGYGNGMYVVDPEKVARGPYPDAKGMTMHAVRAAPYQASSELCGNCHNVSNITLAENVNRQPPHAFGHIERTYSEWALSDYAKKENLKSCQSCHFAQVPSGGKTVKYDSKYGDSHRDYFVRHDATGGSTWVQEVVWRLWKGKDLDHAALQAGQERARAFLKTAAVLGLEFNAGEATLSITNLTGHKLPTGYPEGRRMWVNVRFLGAGSNVLKEIGIYGSKADTVAGKSVNVPTLLDPEATRVYECLPGISPAQGEKYKKAAGKSFHFILNDVILKDNRIPPKGFGNAAFAAQLAAPVPASYPDGQYWDQLKFALPTGTEQVEARLMYQSVSWEYLKFLVEENRTDDWSRRLYEAWQQTGQCPPDEIAVSRQAVSLKTAAPQTPNESRPHVLANGP